jgi:hypothetical protein
MNPIFKKVMRWIDRTLVITVPLGAWFVWRWISQRPTSEISPENSLIYLIGGAVLPWLLELALFIVVFQILVRKKKVAGEGGLFGLWFLIGAGLAVPASWIWAKFYLHQTLDAQSLFWLGFRGSFIVSMVPMVIYLVIWLIAILIIKRD